MKASFVSRRPRWGEKKQHYSLSAEGPVIKCFVLPLPKKKLRRQIFAGRSVRSQNELLSELSCPIKTTRKHPFYTQLTKIKDITKS